MADKTNKIPFAQLLLQYVNTALNIIFPLILFPYMTRTLGPSGYGVIGYFESMMLVVNVWAAFGVNYFGLRLLSKSTIGNQDNSNTVLHLLLINISMATLGMLVYLAYTFTKPVQIGNLTITFLYAYIMVIYMLHADWYFQSQEKYSFLLKRTFILRLFVLVSTLLLIQTTADLTNYIIISAVNYSLLAVSAIWSMRQLLPHWKWDPILFRKLLVSLLPFALMGVLSSLYFTLDTIILARTGRVADLGQYTVAAKIVRLGLNVFIGASIVFFVKLFRNEIDKKLQTESMLMTIHLSIPIGALLFFFAGPTIRFISGEHYLPAIEILRIFSLLWIIVPLHDFFTIQVLMVHHREKALVWLYGSATLLSLVLNLILIPHWFTTGAATAIVGTELLVLLAAIRLSKPYYRLDGRFFREMGSCLLSFPLAYLCAGIVLQITEQPFLQLLTGISAFLLIYLLLQLLVFRNEFWTRLYGMAKNKIMPAA